MSTKETGGPAFPAQFFDERAIGMTLRDWFAAHVPKEAVSLEGWTCAECARELGLPEGTTYEWRKHFVMLVAKLSYEYADAMLEARK